MQWRYGAVGNARWTGARVKDVLARAGLKAGARHLHTFGSDKPPEKVPPFHRSLEIEKALEDGIIAWEMNGQPLPALHGAPARLVVPGWAGEHWMKWLTRISPQADPQTGFYMDTAYRFPEEPGAPGAPVPPEEMQPLKELVVKSNFTDVPSGVRLGTTGARSAASPSRAHPTSRASRCPTTAASPGRTPCSIRAMIPTRGGCGPSDGSRRRRGRRRSMPARPTAAEACQPREAVWNPSGYLYNAWHSAEIEVTA